MNVVMIVYKNGNQLKFKVLCNNIYVCNYMYRNVVHLLIWVQSSSSRCWCLESSTKAPSRDIFIESNNHPLIRWSSIRLNIHDGTRGNYIVVWPTITNFMLQFCFSLEICESLSLDDSLSFSLASSITASHLAWFCGRVYD